MAQFPPLLILAGGLGTRLGQMQGLPKSMVKVLDRPFIEHQLQLLKSQGVEEIVLCVGYGEQIIRDFVGNGKSFGLSVSYSSDQSDESPDHAGQAEKKSLGTGGAVLKASRLIDGPFAFMYGDSYLDLPLIPISQAFCQVREKAMMTVFKNKNSGIKSNLLFENGKIMAYEKERPGEAFEHIDYGLTFCQSDVFAAFQTKQCFDLADWTKQMITDGQLAGWEVSVPFYEIGTKTGIEKLEDYLRRTGGNS